jgi:hypothetical protein
MTEPNKAATPEEWLVGEMGVWAGRPGGVWRRHGNYPFPVHGLFRGEEGLLVGTGYGLWEAFPDPARRWVPLHDETLTEVVAVGRDATGAPVVAGSYGVAVSTADELGLPRWVSLTEDRSPNERFTNALCLAAPDLWLAGTEAGVLVSIDGGARWERTDLMGSPVRCIDRIADDWWAGTDDRGLWRSHDGHAWRRVDCPSPAVFSVAAAGDMLLVGGYDGIYRRDAHNVWERSGPRALIRCLVVDDGTWVAGADPGGVWYSDEEGRSWRRTGPFQRVSVICGPTGGGGA